MRPAAALLTLVAAGAAAGCVQAGVRPAKMIDLKDSADQVFTGFETAITRNGVRRATLAADTARLYEVSQSLALRKARMTFFTAEGVQTSSLSADSVQLFWTNGLITAHGNAVLSAPDGRQLRSEYLRIDDNAREISTDKPFTLSGGPDYVQGTALRTDPEFKNVVAARPKGFTDKPMALPGQ